MNAHDLLKKGAALLAACLTVSACGMFCAAEDDDSAESEQEYASYTSGDFTYHRVINAEDESQKAACIDEYNGSEHDLVIPDEIEGLPVVMLGDYLCAENYYLETVTIPDSLQFLGTYSFVSCSNIKEYIVKGTNENFAVSGGVLYSDDFSVLYRYPIGKEDTEFTVQSGVKTLASSSFAGSKHLKTVHLPDEMEKIGGSAFAESEALESIVIPEGVKLIDEFAFNNCAKLKTVTLPESLQEIGNAAFTATAIEEIKLPSALVTIGEQAFAATKLKEIHIPASVTDIGYTAFGWGVDAYGGLFMDEDFTIYGAPNSSASAYASDSYAGNKFNFVAEEQPVSKIENVIDDVSPDPQEPYRMPVGRMIGIVVCVVLLAVIAVVAVVTGKKSKKGASGNEETH